jgi:hypothetical protein
MHTHLVRLCGPPRQAKPAGTLVFGPDAIPPVEARDEVAARVADSRHAQFLVGGGMAWLVYPGIDSPSHVLNKGPEKPAVDGTDHEMWIDCHTRLGHIAPLL